MQRGTLIALILATCLATGPAYAESVDAGMTAPAWELESGDGTEVQFPDRRQGRGQHPVFLGHLVPLLSRPDALPAKIQDDYSECGVTVYAIDLRAPKQQSGRIIENSVGNSRCSPLVTWWLTITEYSVRRTSWS